MTTGGIRVDSQLAKDVEKWIALQLEVNDASHLLISSPQ